MTRTVFASCARLLTPSASLACAPPSLAASRQLTPLQNQLKELVEVQHYGEALRTTAINIHPKLEDPVRSCCPFLPTFCPLQRSL